VQLVESFGCDLAEQRGKLVLPFSTVGEDGVFQGRAIQQHKLDVENRFLRLYVVGYFCVSVNE